MVTFENCWKFDKQIKSVVKSSFFQLWFSAKVKILHTQKWTRHHYTGHTLSEFERQNFQHIALQNLQGCFWQLWASLSDSQERGRTMLQDYHVLWEHWWQTVDRTGWVWQICGTNYPKWWRQSSRLLLLSFWDNVLFHSQWWFAWLYTCFLQAGKYDESLRHLEGLQELNKDDYKISMNEAIVKFYKSGQTTTGALKQSLMLLKNQVAHFI